MVGTALLRTSESGASAVHQAAIADRSRGETVLTRSFAGLPARGIRNQFIDQYNAIAPSGYPAVHHLTSPIRKAAAAAGDPEAVHLWAGTGFQRAVTGQAADVLRTLATALRLRAHRHGGGAACPPARLPVAGPVPPGPMAARGAPPAPGP